MLYPAVVTAASGAVSAFNTIFDVINLKGGNKLKKVLKTVTFGILGLVLMGSTVGSCNDFQDEAELLGLTQRHSVPLWSKDGSQVIFSPRTEWRIRGPGRRLAYVVSSPRLGCGDPYLPRQLFACSLSQWVSGSIRYGREGERHLRNSDIRLRWLRSPQADEQQGRGRIPGVVARWNPDRLLFG